MANETLLKRILRRLNEEKSTDSMEDDEPQKKRGEIELIRHTTRAFYPGDKVLYWRNDSGGAVKFYAIVESCDGKTLTVKELNTNTIRNYTGYTIQTNILSNNAWLKPLKHFMHGSDKVPQGINYVVDYEDKMGEDGEPLISIKDAKEQKKYLYQHSDGKFVGTESTNRVNVSQWYIKEGQPVPVKIDPSRATGEWKPVDEELFVVDGGGKFVGWRIQKRTKIGEAFPWIREIETAWHNDKLNKTKKKLNPYK